MKYKGIILNGIINTFIFMFTILKKSGYEINIIFLEFSKKWYNELTGDIFISEPT